MTNCYGYAPNACANKGPLLLTLVNLISAWISNHKPCKEWDKISPLKFEHG